MSGKNRRSECKMEVSPKRFLQSGRLGELKISMTEEQIVTLCGEPEMVGGVSSDYGQPSIFKYGNLEIHFSYFPPRICAALFIDYETSDETVQLPAPFVIDDWHLTRNSDRNEVERYLQRNEIEYQTVTQFKSIRPEIIIVTSGVRISFSDEDDRLSAIAVSMDRVGTVQAA